MPSANRTHETGPALAVKALLSADEGAVAADLAERAGIGQSTARKALVALEAAGSARRVEHGTGQAATWYSTATSSPEPAEAQHGKQNTPAQAEEPEPEEPGEHNVPVQAEEPGKPPRSGIETGSDPAPAAEGQDDKRAPIPAPARTRRSSVEGLTVPRVREGRLGHGELGVIVLEAFALNPGERFTAPRLAKLTGRSSGAITNQLVKLAGEGPLTQVAETPATYADARAPKPE
jgi:hypothetical protein